MGTGKKRPKTPSEAKDGTGQQVAKIKEEEDDIARKEKRTDKEIEKSAYKVTRVKTWLRKGGWRRGLAELANLGQAISDKDTLNERKSEVQRKRKALEKED